MRYPLRIAGRELILVDQEFFFAKFASPMRMHTF
jgi:hypothetical protein